MRIVDSGFLRVPMIREHFGLFSGTEQQAVAILLGRGFELALEVGMRNDSEHLSERDQVLRPFTCFYGSIRIVEDFV